jgi:hypothetical protein
MTLSEQPMRDASRNGSSESQALIPGQLASFRCKTRAVSRVLLGVRGAVLVLAVWVGGWFLPSSGSPASD